MTNSANSTFGYLKRMGYEPGQEIPGYYPDDVPEPE